jgi:hypothetical protein
MATDDVAGRASSGLLRRRRRSVHCQIITDEWAGYNGACDASVIVVARFRVEVQQRPDESIWGIS